MNRKERVPTAGDNARETVRHAAEAVAPYAASARDSAVYYAMEASEYLRPRAREAACSARKTYDARLAPRVRAVRERLPEGLDEAALRTADRGRQAARKARESASPRLEAARAAAGPAAERAVARSAGAIAGLRGELTPREIRRAVRRRERRARAWGAAKWVGVAGAVAGGAYAVWKWWDRQANPDWLIEPSAATEVGDTEIFAVEERSDVLRDPELDPEVTASRGDTDESGDAAEEERPPEADEKR